MFFLFLLFLQSAFAGSICNDGTYSDSEGRGTCSHHGGIRRSAYVPPSTYQDPVLPERKVDTTREITKYTKPEWQSASSSSTIELPAAVYTAEIGAVFDNHSAAIGYYCLSETKESGILFRYDNGYRYKTNLRTTPKDAKVEGTNLKVKFEFITSDGTSWEYPMDNAIVLLGNEQLPMDDQGNTWQVNIDIGPKLIARLKDSTQISVSALGDKFTITYSKADVWLAIDTAYRLCLRD